MNDVEYFRPQTTFLLEGSALFIKNVKEAGIALSADAPRAIRVRKAGRFIVDKSLDNKMIHQLAEIAANSVNQSQVFEFEVSLIQCKKERSFL